MKSKIILATIIIAALIIAFSAKSQAGVVHKYPKENLDILLINQFDLTKNGVGLSTNTILLGERAFLQKFGNPVKVSLEYSEEDEASMMHYSYNGADVWYMNNILQAINITSANYSFQMFNGVVIKVGDPISVVLNLFPSSWANKAFPEQIFVSLRNQHGPVDMNLLFEYDSNTNLIKGISVQ